MQLFIFSRVGERAQRIGRIEAPPEEGFVWLDFTRQNAREWPEWAERLTCVKVNEEHVTDSFNGDHPSFFDGTEHYDMVIFQGLTPEDCENSENLIVTKSAAFFMFDRVLITLRSAENGSFDVVKGKVVRTGGIVPHLEVKEDSLDLWERQAQADLYKTGAVKKYVDEKIVPDAKAFE